MSERSPRKSASMNRFILFGLLLLACPGEKPGPTKHQEANPTPTTVAPATAVEASGQAACGSSVLDEGCGDEVNLCGDGDPPGESLGQP